MAFGSLGTDGEHLGTIEVPDERRQHLLGRRTELARHVHPARTSVYRVRMKVAGNRLGYMH